MDLRNGRPVLTGVVAYVEVWSSSRTENYSKTFTQQLLDMGAKISKTLNKQVTHVIFKDGFLSTWNRAQKAGIKLVSVLWVEKCREVGMHIDESLYPAINTNEGLPQFIKKHKCMQPQDLFGKTPEKDRRLQKRMETMVKELEMQRTATETDIPVLLFEDDGSLVYSPASKIKYQCGIMEKRIKDMKEKRENVSPTASQLSQMSDADPAVVSTTSTSALTSELENNHLLNSSFANLVGSPETENHGKKSSNCLANTENVMDVSRAELYTSSDSPRDSQHTGLKRLSGKGLHKNSTLLNDKGCDFPVKKSIMPSTPECKDGIDWFLAIADNPLPQVKNVDHTVSAKNLVHCELTGNTSSSSSENDFSSINLIDTPVMTKNSSLCKQQQYRRKSSLKLKASISHDKEPQNDFLLALLAPSKSAKDQDTSFEDCFSSSNFTKNKIRASILPCQQKLQNDKEMVYNSPRSKLEGLLQHSSPVSARYNRKRKRVTDITEDAVSEPNLSTPLQRRKTGVNCTSNGENGNIVETSDCFLNSNIQEQITISSAAGKLLLKDNHPANNAKFSTSDAKNAACEHLGSHVNEPDRKLKIRRIKKPLRTLVMTSMSPEMQKVTLQVLKKLGGFLTSDEVCKSTSHVIAGSPRRTLNILMGIARGCWIVCYDWVLWSLEHGYWISEEPFELSVDFPAAPISRFQHNILKEKGYQKLFANQPLMFISRTSQPPYQKLCELVQLCGGKICKTLRQAKICIGQCKVGKYVDMQCLSEKWIIDSITQYRICPLENYLFQNKVKSASRIN
ncbi:microcephalin [Protobothrops mucrosquamatus]|uniref:microcephalin n=1 Tax=Protobothrops mucrosquamatus TaxID=103944 RepID=UPI000775A260|nr:microcephalin [Protobothrops mucrosquamatus]